MPIAKALCEEKTPPSLAKPRSVREIRQQRHADFSGDDDCRSADRSQESRACEEQFKDLAERAEAKDSRFPAIRFDARIAGGVAVEAL